MGIKQKQNILGIPSHVVSSSIAYISDGRKKIPNNLHINSVARRNYKTHDLKSVNTEISVENPLIQSKFLYFERH